MTLRAEELLSRRWGVILAKDCVCVHASVFACKCLIIKAVIRRDGCQSVFLISTVFNLKYDNNLIQLYFDVSIFNESIFHYVMCQLSYFYTYTMLV